ADAVNHLLDPAGCPAPKAAAALDSAGKGLAGVSVRVPPDVCAEFWLVPECAPDVGSQRFPPGKLGPPRPMPPVPPPAPPGTPPPPPNPGPFPPPDSPVLPREPSAARII